jgi:hypothetical protein
VADRKELAGPAEEDLLVRDGASTLSSWCSSTISAREKCEAASAAKRIIRTAPSAKFGA